VAERPRDACFSDYNGAGHFDAKF